MSDLDHARVEADFAELLTKGWPMPVEYQRRQPTCLVEVIGAVPFALILMAGQLVNSSVPSTRAFWREKLGLPLDGEVSP